MPSYHDVVVYIGDESYGISASYAYELTCTRTRGWSLWLRLEGKPPVLLGGEFEGTGRFRIEVAGRAICDSGR